MGSTEQYPNGNQMICLATAGTIYEIDAAGNTLWTYSTGGATAQAHRYTPCFIANPAPPQPTISLSGSDLVSTNAVTYQWYLNGNLISGATSQTYTPSQNGIYVVRTTDVNGCVYAYSAGFNTSPSTGISSIMNTVSLHIYPNPSSGKINVATSGKENYNLSVTDATGKIMLEAKNETSLDLSSFPQGVYLIRIITASGKSATGKISVVQ
jgi:hypothetical protein